MSDPRASIPHDTAATLPPLDTDVETSPPLGRAIEPGLALPAPFEVETINEGSLDEGVVRQEHAGNIKRLVMMCWIGIVAWWSFLPFDWLVVRYDQPSPLGRFILLRMIPTVVGLAVLARLYRRPAPSPRRLQALQAFAFTTAAVALCIISVHYRGIATPYGHGLSLLIVGMAMAIPDHWKRSGPLLALPAVAHPLTMGAAALVSPEIAAQFSDPPSVLMFVHNIICNFGVAAFLTIGGHAYWGARRAVFEAKSVGGYRLKRRIGAGAMGEVWLAHHAQLRREVAVKILRPTSASRVAIARFEREVRATAELQHPNTVRVFDSGVTDDGLWYYVMELLSGETLYELARREQGLPPARAVRIVAQASRAIAEAHERGTVHRDIKPQNLFVTALGGEPDFVKVLDFGIAKTTFGDAQATAHTAMGQILGTPAYMAPEQAQGCAADMRSDVYALGITLWFSLVGRTPFEAAAVSGLLRAHVSSAARPPSEVSRCRIPAELDAIVLRCLEKDPLARFASAGELARALAAIEPG